MFCNNYIELFERNSTDVMKTINHSIETSKETQSKIIDLVGNSKSKIIELVHHLISEVTEGIVAASNKIVDDYMNRFNGLYDCLIMLMPADLKLNVLHKLIESNNRLRINEVT